MGHPEVSSTNRKLRMGSALLPRGRHCSGRDVEKNAHRWRRNFDLFFVTGGPTLVCVDPEPRSAHAGVPNVPRVGEGNGDRDVADAQWFRPRALEDQRADPGARGMGRRPSRKWKPASAGAARIGLELEADKGPRSTPRGRWRGAGTRNACGFSPIESLSGQRPGWWALPGLAICSLQPARRRLPQRLRPEAARASRPRPISAAVVGSGTTV